MATHEPKQEATVPQQPEAKAPINRKKALAVVLIALFTLIALTNMTNFMHGKKVASVSQMPARPETASPQQVSSFQMQQQAQAQQDAENRLRAAMVQEAMTQQQDAPAAPGPESASVPPMTPEQRAAIYGASPNAPQQTSEASERHAQVQEKVLARQKERQDAINSDTVAVDFDHSGGAAPVVASAAPKVSPSDVAAPIDTQAPAPATKAADMEKDPLGGYPFDGFQGKLYRMFEGTVLEGVVTNHIDGGLSGPILIMLTTDYYSHDHQQLLLPQGTRLIGNVQSVASGQARKLFVVFHRAICPDGFSVSLDNFAGLDQIGTTGLATKVDHGYFQAFAAAAAIGAIGGLAQIGNGGVLSATGQLQNGISQQAGQEGEQVLNHFLNRLPIITVKEGSRARVYIGRDILIPSYAEHSMDPTL